MSTVLSLNSTAKLSSGYEMPLLGFGVYSNANTKDSVLEAFKAGYRHVDTAQMYENEAEVGAAVRESELDRNEVFITTKITSEDDSHGYENALGAVDTSLQRMQFDYIDLFLIHDPLSGKAKRLETWKALLEAKAVGKIRSAGVSNYGIRHMEEIKEAGLELPSVNQIELHPFCQHRNIVDYCKNNGIVVQAYCPILRGGVNRPEFKRVAAKHGCDPGQVLLRWSLQKGFVPLPKSETPSRIHSNTKLYHFELDENDMKELDALDKGRKGALSWDPVEAP